MLDALKFLRGSETGRVLLGVDWTVHPLGPIDSWPKTLVQTVSVMMASRFPMFCAWGADHFFLYNDAYSEILAKRHPAAMGRRFCDVWPEIWTDVVDLVDRTMAGESIFHRNLPLIMTRKGYEEETSWTFAYSPIHVSDGAIGGMFCACTETTAEISAAKTLAKERQTLELLGRTGIEVAGELNQVKLVQTVVDAGVKLCGAKFGAFFHNVVGDDGDCMMLYALAGANRSDFSHLGAPRAFSSDVFAPPFRGEGVVRSDDILADPRHAWNHPVDGMPTGRLPVRSYLSVPVMVRPGEVIGCLLFGHPEPNVFTDHSEQIIRGLAAQAASGITNARLYKAVQRDNKTLEQRVASASAERDRMWRLSPDLMLEASFDTTILAVNPAWEDLLGWTERDLIGSQFMPLVHESSRAATAAEMGKLAQGGRVHGFENRVRHRDGSYRTLSWTAVPSPNGAAILTVGRDVTAEKQQALVLAEAQAERERLWHSTRDILLVIDSQGRCVNVNPAWTTILGWSREDFIGKAVFDFIVPDDLERTYKALDLANAGLLPVFENRYRHKDGGERWISWLTSPEGDHVFATGRHITAEKEQAEALRTAEEALRQSQKMEAVGQLTGGVAHDFNNLLTVIRSSVDLLKRPNLPEGRRVRYLDAVSDTVDRATKLTSQLLAFARRQTLNPQVFDANKGIETIQDMLRTLVGSRVSLVLRVADTPCTVNADPSQFDAAILNMAVNARDAMGEPGGTLTIHVWATECIPSQRSHAKIDGDFIAITISDTGSGIDPANLERIFEPFFTTKPIGSGTGLGLSQVFGFSKQSGGEVRVESRPGEGTSFTLFLPRASILDDVLDEGRNAGEPECSDGAGQSVLVVEDNIDVGEFAMSALEELGYRPTLMPSADAALEEVIRDASRFDIVFSDVMMPGMNGIEFAKVIRCDFPHLPIVLASGYSDVLAEHGTLGFEILQKPYSIEQLSRLLKKAAPRRLRGI